MALPENVDGVADLLAGGNYVSDRSLATALYLALKLGRPLFLEGEAGVGKTEIAKVLSEQLDRRLIQLQIEREAVRKEKDESSQKRFALIEEEITRLQKEIADPADD